LGISRLRRSTPNVELSVHERIFFALGGGVVPIFDANCFSKRYMPQLERFSFLQSLGDQPSSELR
jgi:hypothetical protein